MLSVYEFRLNGAKVQISGLLEAVVPIPNFFCKWVPVPLVLVPVPL